MKIVEFTIPFFQFHAGNAKLPAGNYRCTPLDNSDLSIMELSSVDGSALRSLPGRKPRLTTFQQERNDLQQYGDPLLPCRRV